MLSCSECLTYVLHDVFNTSAQTLQHLLAAFTFAGHPLSLLGRLYLCGTSPVTARASLLPDYIFLRNGMGYITITL